MAITTANDFQSVKHKEVQKILKSALDLSDKSLLQLAVDAKINSSSTAYAALNSKCQTVSDKVLTRLFKCLNIEGYVIWENGERKYYIKSKIKQTAQKV